MGKMQFVLKKSSKKIFKCTYVCIWSFNIQISVFLLLKTVHSSIKTKVMSFDKNQWNEPFHINLVISLLLSSQLLYRSVLWLMKVPTNLMNWIINFKLASQPSTAYHVQCRHKLQSRENFGGFPLYLFPFTYIANY